MTESVLYNMSLLDEIEEIGEIECLVLAGGSDLRAYEVLRKLDDNKISIKKILLFNFQERTGSLKSDDRYFDYQKTSYGHIELINCSIKKPTSCFTELHSQLSAFDNKKSFAIDISCFTKPYFFYLLKYVHERISISSPTVFYTEPFSYKFPKKGLFSSYHETEGPIKIEEIPGFNGIRERGGDKVLIVLLGFESESLDEIDLDVSPNKSFFVNGFPSYVPKFKDISLVVNENFTGNKDNIILYSRANNPFEVFNLLEKVKKNFNNAFINIAPLGTKPMALGACLFAIHNPEVKVLFPISDKYEKVTTDECWNSWVYQIPLQFN
jgi:hypothetical protein